MGDLPSARVKPSKAFLYTGVDYAGPFQITLKRGRGVRTQKAYLALFICMTTKAVHLELASDLSTSTFIAAFKRFLSRRGPCKTLHSDCGTNFIGAKSYLDDLHSFLVSTEYNDHLKKELADSAIDWKFNPPASPHFGGIWEANIKSVKSHLSRVIGNQILTYEEFSTVLTQIEALLNSRPLSWLSDDPNDPLPLTPAHFLTTTPLTSIPAQDVLDANPQQLSRPELLDSVVQHFWSRWKTEYLHSVQVRQKWNSPAQPVKVGTMVVVADKSPPLQWSLGVIQQVFPGHDGIVRVALVKTKTGCYKRPVVKLCPLPLQ